MEDRARAIVEYLRETYAPEAIVVYGSFADGSNGPDSDFDALVITPCEAPWHDTSDFGDTRLDVFIYPPEAFAGDFDPEPFLQVFVGRIALDAHGTALALVDRVNRHLAALPRKSEPELRDAVAWCQKMLARAHRGDAEGHFRRHWLLTESLEIYMDLRGWRYPGPKKALRQMSQGDHESHALYARALADGTVEALARWVERLEALLPGQGRP